MKKARPDRSSTPSRRSLRALPELEFARYEIRPNRFAVRAKESGIELVHDGPSARSLAAVPEVDLSTVRGRSKVTYVQIGKGRPRRGDEVGPTTVRSVRLPDTVWRALESRAAGENLTVHATLRTAIVRFLATKSAGARGKKARAA